MLSIIIPAYNAEKTIERVLSAIFSQTCKQGFEVIVVDDCSKDKTAELAGKFPVQLIKLKQNSGAGRARNQGAKVARGDILVFVDADVILLPSTLEQIENFFQTHLDYAGLVGNYTYLSYDQNVCSMYHNLFTVYHHELSGYDIEWFWGALSAIRKEVFDKLGGFREDYYGASAEDIEFGYRLAENGYKIRYLKDLRGVHAHYFSLRSMLYNDFRKAVLGVKLYLLRKPRGAHPHGFSSPINGANILLTYLFWISFLALIFQGSGAIFLVALVFFLVNYRFYNFISKKAGALYFLPSVFLHFLSFNAIGLGVIAGLLGILLGKGLESRSRWI